MKPSLYLLTDNAPLPLLLERLAIILPTHVVGLLQIRRKHIHCAEQLLDEVYAIQALAQQYAVPVIINDNVNIAAQVQAGVHLGQGDGSLIYARERLGSDAIIGRTCHGSVELVINAIADGASYVAMGAVFPSKTKPTAKIIDVNAIHVAAKHCATHDVKLCLIGGITLDNVAALNGLPVDYLALVQDLLNCPLEALEQHCRNWGDVLTNWQVA